MFIYQIKKGTTDVSVVVRVIDSTDGTPETAVEHNTAGMAMEYRREGAASTAITEAALAALTTAHTDGGWEHIGNGYYRFDLPDAACASGADGVLVHGTVTGMVVIGCYIQLTDTDIMDGVRGGMTALPNANADAAGGLPISDAGGLDMDSIKTDTAAILVDTGTDGVVLANDAITAAKIAADAIGASELAADGVAEIADAVWDEAKAGHVGVGSFGEEVQAHALSSELPSEPPTAAANADAVWDEARAGHVAAGSFGQGVASVQGDVTGNVDGNVGGNVTGSVGSVTGAVGSVTGNVGGNVTGSVGSLGATAKSDVNAEVVDVMTVDTQTEAYATDGSAATIAELLYMIYGSVAEYSISGTTLTVKKLDGTTTAMTFTLDDATNPTSRTRAT